MSLEGWDIAQQCINDNIHFKHIVLHKSMFLTPVDWCVAVEGVITEYVLCF